jgi:hypothetical protein
MTLDGASACKVGISNAPAIRAKDLSAAGFLTVLVYWAGRFETPAQAYAVEQLAHKRLTSAGLLRVNEWFDCSGVFARGEILGAAEQLGFSFDEDKNFGWTERRNQTVYNSPSGYCALVKAGVR